MLNFLCCYQMLFSHLLYQIGIARADEK
uniref:Uncharacterized protein n=1 Tax=Rhizophora mucronata TaxID=61149 RepID=A0A2P2QZX6_RHIMU